MRSRKREEEEEGEEEQQQLGALLEAAGVRPEHVVRDERVQTLWAGYGEVRRLKLSRGKTVIVKLVRPPADAARDAGASNRRKLRSYQVEASFYSRGGGAELFLERRAALCSCRDVCTCPSIPTPLACGVGGDENELMLAMSDLCDDGDHRGYHPISYDIGSTAAELEAVLRWFAHFHAVFWSRAPPAGLWAEGSYWHLETRHDEYQAIAQDRKWKRLARAAKAIDQRLQGLDQSGARHDWRNRCVVHGDPKSDNIAISRGTGALGCALYDFQYTGGGYGSRDLAYMMCSSFNSSHLDDGQEGGATWKILKRYHELLLERIESMHPGLLAKHPFSLADLLLQFDLAMADYTRFMAGWGMWGSSRWAVKWTERVLDKLDGGKMLNSEEAYLERVYDLYPPYGNEKYT